MRRKGFSFIEVLIVIMTLPALVVILDRMFADLVVDLPRSMDVIEHNGTLLRVLPKLQQDIGLAEGLPQSYQQQNRDEQRLIIRQSDSVIVYEAKEGQIIRKVWAESLIAEGDRADPNEQSWITPQSQVNWSIWQTGNGKPYAVEVHTSVLHRRSKKEKMKNTFVYFLGADQPSGVTYETE